MDDDFRRDSVDPRREIRDAFHSRRRAWNNTGHPPKEKNQGRNAAELGLPHDILSALNRRGSHSSEWVLITRKEALYNLRASDRTAIFRNSRKGWEPLKTLNGVSTGEKIIALRRRTISKRQNYGGTKTAAEQFAYDNAVRQVFFHRSLPANASLPPGYQARHISLREWEEIMATAVPKKPPTPKRAAAQAHGGEPGFEQWKTQGRPKGNGATTGDGANAPSSRVESLQLMDHGLRDARRQEQVRNVERVTKPIGEWLEGVKERARRLGSAPLEAAAQGFFNTYKFNGQVDQIPHEEVLQALQRASEEDGNLDYEAFDEIIGSMPLLGVAGITKCILSKAPDRDALIKDLIVDSNKKFPLTEVNARKMLDELAPPGFTPRTVAGPGGEGADLVFDGPGGQVFKIENKAIESFRGFDKALSHAAQSQAPGNLVFVQVPEGTNAAQLMSKFWGNRIKADILNPNIPENVAKMNVYKNTEIIIADPKGTVLLPRSPIYNP